MCLKCRYQVLDHLLAWCYSDTFKDLDLPSCMELFRSAECYEIQGLLPKCCQRISRIMTVTSPKRWMDGWLGFRPHEKIPTTQDDLGSARGVKTKSLKDGWNSCAVVVDFQVWESNSLAMKLLALICPSSSSPRFGWFMSPRKHLKISSFRFQLAQQILDKSTRDGGFSSETQRRN